MGLAATLRRKSKRQDTQLENENKEKTVWMTSVPFKENGSSSIGLNTSLWTIEGINYYFICEEALPEILQRILLEGDVKICVNALNENPGNEPWNINALCNKENCLVTILIIVFNFFFDNCFLNLGQKGSKLGGPCSPKFFLLL